MSLLLKSNAYKPMSYEWAFEYYKVQQSIHWLPEEVPLSEDVTDWWKKLSLEERNLLTQIFRFFTQGDVDVAAGYYDRYIPVFKNNEIRMMLGSFANMEAIHQHAYSLLLDTVGMPEDEYQAFREYEQMAAKHEYLTAMPELTSSFEQDNLRNIAKSMAVYSAFTEGLQLFSSFAILLNFTRFNRMKGMGQIVSWSVRDETLHVEGMTKLFRTFIQENPDIWTDELRGEIYQICRDMVSLEDHFIDLAFEMGPINGLDKDEVKRYIRYIADRRLLQLGLKTNYDQRDNPIPWIVPLISGQEHVNFFENRGTEYAKAQIKGWEDAYS